MPAHLPAIVLLIPPNVVRGRWGGVIVLSIVKMFFFLSFFRVGT